MTCLREGLPVLPSRMRSLRIDERGYPVPWFVVWIDGKPDFRVADGQKLYQALIGGNCWICGETTGRYKTFVIGPMCAVNRTTSEPACHKDCAQFAVMACPFLTLPKAQRRESNLPEQATDPAGIMIKRNPGVTLLWTTTSFERVRDGNGFLFQLGNPQALEWYAQGRTASRAEIMESIDSGMPSLRQLADLAGPKAQAQLQNQYNRMLTLLPPWS